MEDDTLARITQSSEAVADAERNLRQAVAIARNAQRTWAQIGDALGVTRQAAQRKYGDGPTLDVRIGLVRVVALAGCYARSLRNGSQAFTVDVTPIHRYRPI